MTNVLVVPLWDGGTAIECDVGVYIVVKVVSLVQLEVYGRFCPEPAE